MIIKEININLLVLTSIFINALKCLIFTFSLETISCGSTNPTDWFILPHARGKLNQKFDQFNIEIIFKIKIANANNLWENMRDRSHHLGFKCQGYSVNIVRVMTKNVKIGSTYPVLPYSLNILKSLVDTHVNSSLHH